MWALFQVIRRQAKLGLSLFVLDLLLLTAIMMVTSAITKQVMHPAISIIGTLWVLATAAAIWHLGGVEVDFLFFARMLGIEKGREFTRALDVFFILGSTTVIFFFLFPAWKFWAGTVVLPVLLVGIFTCANMSGRRTNWNLFFWIYASITGVILLAIVIAGLTGWTTESGLVLIQRTWFKNWIERLLILGFIFLAFSFIPKMPQKILRLGAGLAIITSIILLVFPEIQPSHLVPDQSTKGTKALTHKSSSSQKAPPAVEQSLIPTGITLAPGDSLRVTKDPSAPAIPLTLRLSDGEEREFPASFWGARQMNYSHTGTIIYGRSATIFYQGEAGKYHFQKISPASPSPAVQIMPASFSPSTREKLPEPCPFD